MLVTLLLLVLVSWLNAEQVAENAIEVARVERADGGAASAAVLDADWGGIGIRFMRYGDCLLGAKFTSDEYGDQSPFTAFSVMSAGITRVARLMEKVSEVPERGQEDRPTSPLRMLQLGLGAGTVPSLVQEDFQVIDVVEYSPTVVEFAKNHFGYKVGKIITAEALEFLFQENENQADKDSCPLGEESRYDILAMDLYIGHNPTHVLNKELFERVKSHWLEQSQNRGVFVLNFVGFHRGEYSLFARSIAYTLRDVYKHVQCVSDSPPMAPDGEGACNIICFCTDVPSLVEFGDPDTAIASMELGTIDNAWIANNFNHWQVLSPAQVAVPGLPPPLLVEQSSDLSVFQAGFEKAARDMKDLIRPLLSEHQWV